MGQFGGKSREVGQKGRPLGTSDTVKENSGGKGGGEVQVGGPRELD